MGVRESVDDALGESACSNAGWTASNPDRPGPLRLGWHRRGYRRCATSLAPFNFLEDFREQGGGKVVVRRAEASLHRLPIDLGADPIYAICMTKQILQLRPLQASGLLGGFSRGRHLFRGVVFCFPHGVANRGDKQHKNTSNPLLGPVAQRLEQGTHNPLVQGSNPCGPTLMMMSCRIQN